MKRTSAVAVLLLMGFLGGVAGAQEQVRSLLEPAPQPCPVYKSPEVQKHIDKAFALVGDDLPKGLIPSLFIIPRASGLCAPAGVAAFNFDTSTARPIQAFDQLYYVGNHFVGSWVLKTSAGIILFDAMNNSEDARNIVEPGMRQLGLDPADVKYIIVTHGHFDHWGGAKYFQDKYRSRVLVGRGDVPLLALPQAPGRQKPTPPVVDQEVTDGMNLTLGETTVKLYISPGHTPGTVSAIFPVTDRGQSHLVGLFGGYGLPMQFDPDTTEPPRSMGLRTYMKSVARFAQLGEAAGVDTGISTHPIFDDTLAKGDLVASGRGSRSPWVLGQTQWVRYMDANLEVARTVEAMMLEHPVTRRLDKPTPAAH